MYTHTKKNRCKVCRQGIQNTLFILLHDITVHIVTVLCWAVHVNYLSIYQELTNDRYQYKWALSAVTWQKIVCSLQVCGCYLLSHHSSTYSACSTDISSQNMTTSDFLFTAYSHSESPTSTHVEKSWQQLSSQSLGESVSYLKKVMEKSNCLMGSISFLAWTKWGFKRHSLPALCSMWR